MGRSKDIVQAWIHSVNSEPLKNATKHPPLSLFLHLFSLLPHGEICLRMKPAGRKARMATRGPGFCLVSLSAPSEKQCLSPESTARAPGGQFSLARPGRSGHLLPHPCSQRDGVLVPTTQVFYTPPGSGVRKPLQHPVDRERRRTWFLKESGEREVTPGRLKQLTLSVINYTEILKECRAEANNRRKCSPPCAPAPALPEVCIPNPRWNLGRADLIPLLVLWLLSCKRTTQNPQQGKKWGPG